MHERFPFPSYPSGWYVVHFSHELAPGEVKTLRYFGQDIVLFRTESGVASLVDKTCPHLGAHLGGGHVKGECLRCPFHDWGFNTQGQCVDVPYAPKIPARAQVRAWAVDERDGLIFTYYSHDKSAPTWQLPELDSEGWTPNRTIRWELDSHPQEVAENTVDCSHLRPVHHVTRTDIELVEQNDHVMRVVLRLEATGAAIQMPEEVNDVELDVTLHSLGQIISRTHVLTAGLRTRQRIHPTPIAPDRIAIFAVANTREMPDPDYTREIDTIFWDAFTEDFAKDFPIWGNKVYLEKPLLAGGDGPIGRYRKWARQFYAYDAAAPEVELVDEPLPLRRAFERLPAPAQAVATRLAERLGGMPAFLAPLARRFGAVSAPAEAPVAEPSYEPETPARAPRSAPAPTSGPRAFPTVEAYFAGLPARFDANAAGNLEAVFQWVLPGAEPPIRYAEVSRGTIRCGVGGHANPTVTIEMSEPDYLLMINGELNGARAFSTGRGKLKGPVTLAMKMQRIFPLPKVAAGA